MKTGQYNEKKIDYSKYSTIKFVPHIYNSIDFAPISSCGVSMAALLTGINPYKIQKSFGKNNHTSDKQLINFLRRHGFTVKEITKCRMVNGQSRLSLLNKIIDNNIILVSQLYLKNEGSWSVINNGRLWHKSEVFKLNGLDFVNRPILSAFCLFHPKYNI